MNRLWHEMNLKKDQYFYLYKTSKPRVPKFLTQGKKFIRLTNRSNLWKERWVSKRHIKYKIIVLNLKAFGLRRRGRRSKNYFTFLQLSAFQLRDYYAYGRTEQFKHEFKPLFTGVNSGKRGLNFFKSHSKGFFPARV